MNLMPAAWEARLQASRCRLTKARKAVMLALLEAEHPLTAQELFAQARQKYPRLGIVTVYRTLEWLERLGLTWRVVLPAREIAYLPVQRQAEVVLLCQVCGHAEAVHEQTLEVLLEYLAQKSGYRLTPHPLEVTGTCAVCQQKSDS